MQVSAIAFPAVGSQKNVSCLRLMIHCFDNRLHSIRNPHSLGTSAAKEWELTIPSHDAEGHFQDTASILLHSYITNFRRKEM